ncbi:hypothetical protein AB3F25_03250 [Aggregatibacter sp. HMT-949]|uniref:hypothetical protein n=1 Tax=Aggregatibacter sp. HMT-949 TaxID=3235088 RepID=UPI00359C154A
MSNKKSDWPRYHPTVFMDGSARGDKRGLELKSLSQRHRTVSMRCYFNITFDISHFF